MITEMTVEQILAGYDDKAPLSDAYTIPAPWYVDPRIAELEQQTVFSKTWQVIGRVDQVEKPGQFVTATVAGEPATLFDGGWPTGAASGLRRTRHRHDGLRAAHAKRPPRLPLYFSGTCAD